jgi:hypothetical protein
MSKFDDFTHVVASMARAAVQGLGPAQATGTVLDDVARWETDPTSLDLTAARWTPWTDGYAVGYKLERPGVDPAFVYLNPSSTGMNVFLYSGPNGNPGQDGTLVYVEPLKNL